MHTARNGLSMLLFPLSAILYFLLSLLLLPVPVYGQRFEFRDNDRIVLVGNTFVERDQLYGYFETFVTAANPQLHLTFRNLGWSGDTVQSDVRAGSGPAKGLAALVEVIVEQKPTVIIIGYGMNESFKGESELASFREGYRKLLDALEPLNARIVLVSPIQHEKLPPPLPDSEQHNRDLAMYVKAIAQIADQRKLAFVDLFDGVRKQAGQRLTDDGIHLNPLGYWLAGNAMAERLSVKEFPFVEVVITGKGEVKESHAAAVSDVSAAEGLKFTVKTETLPVPCAPPASLVYSRTTLKVLDLPEGNYFLTIDGQTVGKGSSAEWRGGVILYMGPGTRQVEELRSAIREKNVLFFDRYRPANDMYIFWGRKHEQGRNAKEIPEFDKFIAEKESEIEKLKMPRPQVWELRREEISPTKTYK